MRQKEFGGHPADSCRILLQEIPAHAGILHGHKGINCGGLDCAKGAWNLPVQGENMPVADAVARTVRQMTTGADAVCCRTGVLRKGRPQGCPGCSCPGSDERRRSDESGPEAERRSDERMKKPFGLKGWGITELGSDAGAG